MLALVHMLALLLTTTKIAPLSGMHWRSIGPAIAGGRTIAVTGSDRSPLLYFTGVAGGGLYRTRDGGMSWQDVWSHKPVASVGAVTVASSDDRIVWAGTGEGNPRNDASYGDGIWRSLDGGSTWHHMGLDSSFVITRILVDPRAPQIVLAGALGDTFKDSEERGVYRSSDGGVTWSKVLYPGPSTGIADLAWNANDPRVVFAAAWQFRRKPWTFDSGGPDDGLYRSTDEGRTWSKVSGGGFPSAPLGRIGVVVAPSDARRVYAVVQSKDGVLWRSDDAGKTWALVNSDSEVNQRPFYMSRIAVDPSDADHLFAMSENLVESTDGGRHFHEVTSADHQDHHDLWIARGGLRMIESSDGGSPISLDGGKTWDERYNTARGQLYHVGYDLQNPYDVCGGLQDNDSFCGPSDSLNPLGILNADWRDVGNDGDGSWVWPDPRDPSLVWNVGVSALNGQLGIDDERSRQNLDVSPSVRDTNGSALAGLPYRFNWEAPIAFSAREPDAAYFGGNVVFKTLDRGRHWTRISPDLTLDDPQHQQQAGGPVNFDVSGAEFYDTILDIAPSPRDSRVIWVGTDDGLVQLTRDGGRSWRNVTMKDVGAYGRVACVEASAWSVGAAFAVVDRHFMGDPSPYVFATNDFGATWRPIAAGLPSLQYAHAVRQDPRNPDVLYLGLEQSVWVSFDRGGHWEPLQLDMPTVAARDLRVQPVANDLIVATHGRGFWILDDLAPLQSLVRARAAGDFLFQPRTAYQFWRWWSNGYGNQADECCATAGEFVGENPPAGVMVSYFLRAPLAAAPQLEFVDSRGRVAAHFDGTNNAGVNRVSWDLAEDGPVRWNSARDWNKGPSEGPSALPGAWTVRLRMGSHALSRGFAVKPDPRAHWTMPEYEARYRLVRELDGEISAIDIRLNALDARGLQKSTAYRALTSNPVNSEDDLMVPDGLRERVATLLLTLGLSQGPPSAAHLREAAEIRAQFNAAMGTHG
jgi:photosystem II stability/assembly factor-like uncharacterized protein